MGQHSFERERDRQGFRELAKLAGPQPRPKANTISGIRRATNPAQHASTENDSGLVDLEVLATNDPGAVDRASVTPLASVPLFADETAAPRSTPSRPAPSRPTPSQPVVAPESSRPAVQAGPLSSPSELRPIVSAPVSAPVSARAPMVRPRRSPVGLIGAAVGLAAIAASAVFVVRSKAPEAQVATSGDVIVQAQTQAVAVAAAQPVAQAPAPAHSDPGVDPMSLPKENEPATGHHVAAARSWHGAHAGGQALVAKADPKDDGDDAPAAKAEAPKAAAPPAPKAAEAPAVPANNALLASIKSAAASAPAPTAASEPASVPAAAPIGAAAVAAPGSAGAQRPSQGQITGALAGVLPAARACLNDDDEPSRAHVVFGSDGAVQSVGVNGPAQGKPAEACIKAALGKAHVPPFAEASYGATVTVRP